MGFYFVLVTSWIMGIVLITSSIHSQTSTELPRSQLSKPGFTYLRSASLAFDPLKSPYYKVIYFWCKDILGNKYRIETYSSKNSCWKLCGGEYSFPLSPHKAGVFWNGSLSWIYKQGSLFYFDIDKELTAEVPRHLPDDGRYWETEYKIECFDTYKGHLRFIEVSRKASTFSVFHMDVEYTGWNLKYRVDLEGLKVSYPKLCSGYSVLYVLEREESPKLIVLVHDCKIISYDFHNMLSKEVYDIMRVASSEQKYSGGLYNVYKYMESLAHV